jgi:hypothetical protein
MKLHTLRSRRAPRRAALAALACLAGLALSESPSHATPPTTAFTYQGRLTSSGAAVTGTSDIQFSLYDAATGGTQLGSTVTVLSVTVTDGLFTVPLDFGISPILPEASTSPDRWLEIAARTPAGTGSYTTLTPRQKLTPTPLALYAQTAELAFNLLLPWHGSVATALNAFWVTNAGAATGGSAAKFDLVSPDNSSDAMIVSTAGDGSAIYAVADGAGAAIDCINDNGGITGTEHGILATTLGLSRAAAGVYAVGLTPSAAGMPHAAALTVKGGINVVGALPDRPAGSLVVPGAGWMVMSSCNNGPGIVPPHFHPIGYYTDIPLANHLIIAGDPDPAGSPPAPGVANVNRSIILATVETTLPPPQTSYYVQVHSVGPGTCVFRVTRMATFDVAACPIPGDAITIHYQIINPLP